MTKLSNDTLIELATSALLSELYLFPKVGLVSQVDCGSHCDMDYTTFIQSINSLKIYWGEMVVLGQNSAPFTHLVAAGLSAERRMLLATNGVNTHRGAIFILGILIAAAAHVNDLGKNIQHVAEYIQRLWGQDILSHRRNSASHGSKMLVQYPDLAGDLIQEAAGGFSSIFNNYLPYLKAHAARLSVENSYLQLFYWILSTMADNNLLHRGGRDGLLFARQQAQNFINAGGAYQIGFEQKLIDLHHEFIARNLSPGGCADMLAATIFVNNVDKLWG